MRLNKFIAQSGVASRRKADELIIAGRVWVNGEKITELGTQIHEGDTVEVDGKHIFLPETAVTIALYKPRGVTTTRKDAHAEKTVMDILPPEFQQLKPVGRLDRESEGLLILTTDGTLHQELTHPSFEHEKEYEVTAQWPFTGKQLTQLRQGIPLEEGIAQAKHVRKIAPYTIRIVLTQGFKRQIRRMLEACGNHVTILKRIRVGKLTVHGLAPGDIRRITRSDIL